MLFRNQKLINATRKRKDNNLVFPSVLSVDYNEPRMGKNGKSKCAPRN